MYGNGGGEKKFSDSMNDCHDLSLTVVNQYA